MLDIYVTNEAETVLLVDAKRVFISLNRQVFLHNIKHIFLLIATFVRNSYSIPARLFALGNKEALSHKDTTHGDSNAMTVYEIALPPATSDLLS